MRLNVPRGRAGPLASACYIPPHLAPTDAHTEDLTPQSNLFVAQPGCWQAQDLGAQALRRELLWFFSYVRLKIHFSASITPQFRPILGLLMLRAKSQQFRASPTKSSFVSIFGFLFLVHTDLGELLRQVKKPLENICTGGLRGDEGAFQQGLQLRLRWR